LFVTVLIHILVTSVQFLVERRYQIYKFGALSVSTVNSLMERAPNI